MHLTSELEARTCLFNNDSKSSTPFLDSRHNFYRAANYGWIHTSSIPISVDRTSSSQMHVCLLYLIINGLGTEQPRLDADVRADRRLRGHDGKDWPEVLKAWASVLLRLCDMLGQKRRCVLSAEGYHLAGEAKPSRIQLFAALSKQHAAGTSPAVNFWPFGICG